LRKNIQESFREKTTKGIEIFPKTKNERKDLRKEIKNLTKDEQKEANYTCTSTTRVA
jgi:hypothetical protein